MPYLRSCPNCSLTVFPVYGFCTQCLKRVYLRTSPQNLVSEKGFSVRSLYTWVPGQSDELSFFFKVLKEPHSEKVFPDLAQIFLRAFASDLPEGQYLIVPAPPREEGVCDHAHFWARSLAEGTQGHCAPLLQRRSLFAQKSQTRSMRKNVRLSLHRPAWESLNRCFRFDRVIFVDDVYTTGSTAMAAYKALDFPDKFEVWTIARRTFLLS